jgi:hypothetical protein
MNNKGFEKRDLGTVQLRSTGSKVNFYGDGNALMSSVTVNSEQVCF